MNITKIKEDLTIRKGKKLKFRFNGSRNQIEEFFGEIVSTHDSIFVIKLRDKEGVKSFSYSDILIKKLVVLS